MSAPRTRDQNFVQVAQGSRLHATIKLSVTSIVSMLFLVIRVHTQPELTYHNIGLQDARCVKNLQKKE